MSPILELVRLADAPVGTILVLKATAVLLAAWLATWGLSRANPRWRVLVWRAAALGLAAVVVMAATPPLVTWRVASRPRPASAPLNVAPTSAIARAPIPVPAGPEPLEEFRAWPAVPPSPLPPSTPAPSPTAWLAVVWLGGVAVLGLRFAIGDRRLSRVVRRAEDASEAVQSACRETASRLGVKRRVRVVSTSEVASPCLTGLLRPVVLLPEGMDLDAPGPDLDAVLVHELTHVRNGDLLWNDALHLASIVLWFHPLAWRIRHSHAAACDAVCDAVAVDRLGDVATYGRALARLALRANASPPVHGLAMARACDVRRRIASLQRFVYRSPLPRRLVMPALLVTAVFAALIGGAAVIRAQEDPLAAVAKKVDDPAKKTMTIRVVDAVTGSPLEGAEVENRQQLRWMKEPVVNLKRSGAEGVVDLEYPAGADLRSFSLVLRKPGFASASFWRIGTSVATIEIPGSQEFRLVRGRLLVGEVVDEVGKPVQGASVELKTSTGGDPSGIFNFPFVRLKSDSQGRWRTDEAPEFIDGVTVDVEHSDYRPARTSSSQGFKATLTKGARVNGRILDSNGNPVARAWVSMASRRSITQSQPQKTETDADGSFTLPKVEPGPSHLIAAADGFGLQVQDVSVMKGGATPAVEVVLSPAETLHGRVVDRAGKPIKGVHCSPSSWRGRNQLWTWIDRFETDADGRFTWRNAPSESVSFGFVCDDYISRLNVSLKAGISETLVVMDPPLAISGSVVDSVTRRPIPKFTLFHAFTSSDTSEAIWSRFESKACSNGRFDLKLTTGLGKGVLLRVEAPGYKPLVSRSFRPDEGVVTQDFELEPAPVFDGIVLLPNGLPAADVEVALSTLGSMVAVKGPAVTFDLHAEIVKTNSDGRFVLPAPKGAYRLLAVGAAGMAEASDEEFVATPTLKLAAWGRIEGRLLVRGQPARGVTVRYTRAMLMSLPLVDFDVDAQTDADGRFSFAWIPPGRGHVCRVVGPTNPEGSASLSYCWAVPVEVEAGKKLTTSIGGKGRTVVGRLVARDRKPADWTRLHPVVLSESPSLVEGLARLRRNPDRLIPLFKCGAGLDVKGRFRIDDVPPGDYRLTAETSNAVPPGERRGEAVPTTTKDINVPDGDESLPIDVGDIIVDVNRPGSEEENWVRRTLSPVSPPIQEFMRESARKSIDRGHARAYNQRDIF